MVDRMLLLNKGKVVYEGPPNDVKQYFANIGHECPPDWNPADFILDVISDRNHNGSESDDSEFLGDMDVTADVESPAECSKSSTCSG